MYPFPLVFQYKPRRKPRRALSTALFQNHVHVFRELFQNHTASSYNTSPLASRGCCHKWPHAGRLPTTTLHSLTVPEARLLNEGVSKAMLLPEILGEVHFLALSSLFWSPAFVTCGYTATSTRGFALPSALFPWFPYLCFLQGRLSLDLGPAQ